MSIWYFKFFSSTKVRSVFPLSYRFVVLGLSIDLVLIVGALTAGAAACYLLDLSCRDICDYAITIESSNWSLLKYPELSRLKPPLLVVNKLFRPSSSSSMLPYSLCEIISFLRVKSGVIVCLLILLSECKMLLPLCTNLTVSKHSELCWK